MAVGDTTDEYERVYDAVIAAQAAGLAAVRPGVLAREVDAACRQVIVDAGYGEWFRHRTGHCIGLDVHEYPFISEEDETPLEAGMTFTIEPSVFWPGRVGVRIEDIVLVTEDGGVKLNEYSNAMVVVDGSPSLGSGGAAPDGGSACSATRSGRSPLAATSPRFSTLLPTGGPAAQVMWIDCDDECLLINTEVHRQKFKNGRARPPRRRCACGSGTIPTTTSRCAAR